MTSDPNRTARMASIPGNEISETKLKLFNTDYPLSVIKKFNQKSSRISDFIMPLSLFEIPKKEVLVEIPYCLKIKFFKAIYQKV